MWDPVAESGAIAALGLIVSMSLRFSYSLARLLSAEPASASLTETILRQRQLTVQ